MFASICIQLQELTKEKTPGEEVFFFFCLCFLSETEKNSYFHGILIHAKKKKRKEKLAVCEAEIRGEGTRG